MTELTIKNFKDEYPRLVKAVEECRFISIDTEFSGLSVSDKLQTSLFDTTPERYEKLRKNCEQLIPVQLGITCFTFDSVNCSYTADIFTIFLFPRTFSLYDKRFVCQSSSLQFLCDNSFDFNKLIYEGVPYINRTQEQTLVEDLKNKTFALNPYQSSEIENVLDEQGRIVASWIFSAKDGDVQVLPQLQKYVYNPDILYTAHKHLRERFKDSLWTFEDKGQFTVKKVSKEELALLIKENDLDKNIILDILGITRLFRLLVTLKKPIVGHNLLTDLMLLIHNLENPLPTSYEKFKRLVNELFPAVYDTKCLSFSILKKHIPNSKRWQQNTLSHLYNYFKGGEGRHLAANSPLIQPRVPLEKYDQFHNAGWDSYCTGYIFIRMGHIYATNKFKQSRKYLSNELFSAVSGFKNKVNLIRASLAHIQLDGEDPPSSRPPYLVVESSRNKPLNISQIASMLSSFGFVEVKPFSFGRKAIVAVDNFNSAKSILKNFANHKEIRIKMYSTFKHSPVARTAIWGGIFLTGAILAWMTNKKLKLINV
ncbi:pre-piRNA 3'-exonuclease trimmer-like [Agrilus planipennis]|uniref:Pre-piRNA 3'-exonuclease trimmer-like n=1 Tax=Agrilus planipennis TaxID=224129 RepID=A0A1W4XI64_AGRPL|nr:pre-piRNA 3'-exonuclease trimmer-like [Agrilus planipennis]